MLWAKYAYYIIDFARNYIELGEIGTKTIRFRPESLSSSRICCNFAP